MQSSSNSYVTLQELYKWCHLYRLSINKDKTKHMVVQKDTLEDCEILMLKLYDKGIENIHSYNYLGVVIDDKLSFDNFIDSKYKRVNFRVHQLGKVRKYINNDIAITICKQNK